MSEADPTQTATAGHLKLLDELAETGMILIRRLHQLPPLPGQDVSRDFEILSRSVRRSILMYHLLEQGRLPGPKQAPAAERPAATGMSGGGGDRPRIDSVDKLEDVSGPFTQVVAEIVQDIQAALATCHPPVDQAEFIQEIARRPLPIPDRPEADAADLK